MRLFTNATLGVAAVVACAGGAVAQQVPGCSSCGPRQLAGGVPNRIPHCNKHDGLTQYPLSDKRYIKQFCNPTICPNSCFGHFKTQWTPWPAACPGWPDNASAAGFGLAPTGPATAPIQLVNPPVAPPETAPAPTTPPAPKPETNGTPPAPPTKPLDLPPSKPVAPKSPLDVPAPTPMPPVTVPPMPEGKLPALPPAGEAKF